MRELLSQIPTDIVRRFAGVEAVEQTSYVREYLDYTSFFVCLEKHSEWTEAWSRRSSQGYVMHLSS